MAKTLSAQDPGGDDGEEDGVEGVGDLAENYGRKNSVNSVFFSHRAKNAHTNLNK